MIYIGSFAFKLVLEWQTHIFITKFIQFKTLYLKRKTPLNLLIYRAFINFIVIPPEYSIINATFCNCASLVYVKIKGIKTVSEILLIQETNICFYFLVIQVYDFQMYKD